MGRRFSLGAVLRARTAQEDAARGAAARARQESASAAETVRRRDRALIERPPPPPGTALAFVAAIAAARHRAIGLAAAVELSATADAQVRERTAELSEATVRRRVLERLAERHAAAARRAEDAAEQRAVDDLTVTAAHRRTAASRETAT